MSLITGLEKKRSRVTVYIAGKPAFTLSRQVAASADLSVGQELSHGRAADIVSEDRFNRCLNAAARYLGYRPHSESELRAKLGRRFGPGVTERAIGVLRERKLIDDAAFAGFWQENRQSLSPRSRSLTRLELRRKGVSREVADEVVSSDDYESAYRAALSRSKHFHGGKDDTRRLSDFLKRRGFSYEVISTTIDKLIKGLNSEGVENGN